MKRLFPRKYWFEIEYGKPNSVNTGGLFFGRICIITGRTNEFICCARNCITEIKKSKRVSQWKDVNAVKIKGFIGLVLQMGSCPFPSIEPYWSTNESV